MNNAVTIQDLRSKGFRVFVRHVRRFKEKWVKVSEDTMKLEQQLQPRGGKTLVEVVSPSGQSFKGEAICQNYISYNKKMAVEVALGRAIKSLQKESHV